MSAHADRPSLPPAQLLGSILPLYMVPQCELFYGRYYSQYQFQMPQSQSGGGGGGDSNIKKVGMLVVALRGVNFRFWSHLGC